MTAAVRQLKLEGIKSPNQHVLTEAADCDTAYYTALKLWLLGVLCQRLTFLGV